MSYRVARNRCLPALATLLLVLASTLAHADFFLKIRGVEGEATDKDHKGWCDIVSFSHSISKDASYGIPGTAPSAHGALQVTKQIDRATPILARLCSEGAALSSATVELTTTNVSTDRVPYMKYELTDVVISSVEIGGTAGDVPMESIALNYGKIRWTYYRYDTAGQLIETIQHEWDVAGAAKRTAARASTLRLK
jgi:type VI secretion system secreted protein Hcp